MGTSERSHELKIIFRARIIRLDRKVANQSLSGHMKIIYKHENAACV